jgi:DNA-binding transcriptional MerR regulator
MVKKNNKYSIGELVNLTGVTRRTVHYYSQRNLIPPPEGKGRGHHYNEEHVKAIQKIRALQSEGVTLDRIPEVLAGLTAPDDEIEIVQKLTTRINIGEGVWIEFDHGTKIPPPSKIRELIRFYQKITGHKFQERKKNELFNQ